MTMERRALLQLLAASGLPAASALAAATAPDARLRRLCGWIVPGAIEAGAPEFIELLASENPEYRRQLAGGLLWLDARCQDRFGKPFLECQDSEQKEALDQIAFRESAAADQSLGPGIAFFAFLRDLTLDAYFTSRQGIEYLGFKGNSPLTHFPGCPVE